MSAKISFGTFEEASKVNPYRETIDQLAALNDPKATVVLEVDVNDVQKEQFRLQRAANEIGKTARLRLKDESAVKEGKPDDEGNPTHTGNVVLTFTLGAMHKARRGPRNTVVAESVEEETASA